MEMWKCVVTVVAMALVVEVNTATTDQPPHEERVYRMETTETPLQPTGQLYRAIQENDSPDTFLKEMETTQSSIINQRGLQRYKLMEETQLVSTMPSIRKKLARSRDQKGLLGGLLGGGGGGGLLGGGGQNCSEKGASCQDGGDPCCPAFVCVQVPLVGINLCV